MVACFGPRSLALLAVKSAKAKAYKKPRCWKYSNSMLSQSVKIGVNLVNQVSTWAIWDRNDVGLELQRRR